LDADRGQSSAPIDIESRGSDPILSTLIRWGRALEAAGVRFIHESEEEGPGVRMQKCKAAAKRN